MKMRTTPLVATVVLVFAAPLSLGAQPAGPVPQAHLRLLRPWSDTLDEGRGAGGRGNHLRSHRDAARQRLSLTVAAMPDGGAVLYVHHWQ